MSASQMLDGANQCSAAGEPCSKILACVDYCQTYRSKVTQRECGVGKTFISLNCDCQYFQYEPWHPVPLIVALITLPRTWREYSRQLRICVVILVIIAPCEVHWKCGVIVVCTIIMLGTTTTVYEDLNIDMNNIYLKNHKIVGKYHKLPQKLNYSSDWLRLVYTTWICICQIETWG